MLVTSEPVVEKVKNKRKVNRIIFILTIIVLITAIGFSTFLFLQRPSDSTTKNTVAPEVEEPPVTWQFTGQSWISTRQAPECPEPFLISSPVNVELSSSVLYPGQERGGDYKAHGGFRFDNVSDANEVEVVLPIDAVLIRGVRYIENNETQYMLDFVTECGYLLRFDHLKTLTRFFAEIITELPEAVEGDTRTTNFQNPILYPAGTFIASAVGFQNPKNIFVDFGVYDLRNQNQISENPEWAQKYSTRKELAYFGVCWIDLLEEPAQSLVKNLPSSDTQSGKKSDYCN